MDERKNNSITLVGEIVSGFRYSHTVLGERFYLFDIEVRRKSGTVDRLPVVISDCLIDVTKDYIGEIVEIIGQVRTFNQREDTGNKLIISVFAQDIRMDPEINSFETNNMVLLDGYICKPTIYRETPFGRQITDLILAVNRQHKKTDYIPCICWGRCARYVSEYDVGTHIRIEGRLQSRKYIKRLSDTETEERTAYELSASKVVKEE